MEFSRFDENQFGTTIIFLRGVGQFFSCRNYFSVLTAGQKKMLSIIFFTLFCSVV
jgi:hypothetical protein